MNYKGLTLDKFQVDAIKSIENNHSVVVSAPTGSGKTLIADYIINKYVKKGVTVIYTAPIKALSNQKYKEFSKEYGKENVGLVTGDVTINPGAPVVIMTTEIYRNMAITDDPALDSVSYVVFDEIHYINDIERGYVWEESIIFSKKHVRFLCLSATIPNADEFSEWIKAIKKHNVDTIKHDKRPVPLHRKFWDEVLETASLDEIKKQIDDSEKTRRLWDAGKKRKKPKTGMHLDLVREIAGKLPCFFFTFSRQRCQDYAMELAGTNMFKPNPEITAFIRKKLSGAPAEINNLKSMRQLRKTLPSGIGFHHAGLIPLLKELVEELFSQGLIKVLYTTETFAVGINMPAKTVCFDSLMKYDGISFRYLNSKEYFQIAGRAGRRGIDKEGFVYAIINRRDFNYGKIKNMTTKDVEPIRSQFRLSVNTVLNLIKQHTPKETDKILCMNFATFQRYGKTFETKKKGEIYRSFNNIKKTLLNMGYIKDNKLTEKGRFSSKIYADEILTGEIFATRFYKSLDEYQMLLVICAICYEERQDTEFFEKYPSKAIRDLNFKISGAPRYICRERRFRNIKKLSAIIQPCMDDRSIFDIIGNTNLLEGDIIRLLRQIIDRTGQIRKATKDYELIETLKNIERRIIHTMKDIDVI